MCKTIYILSLNDSHLSTLEFNLKGESSSSFKNKEEFHKMKNIHKILEAFIVFESHWCWNHKMLYHCKMLDRQEAHYDLKVPLEH